MSLRDFGPRNGSYKFVVDPLKDPVGSDLNPTHCHHAVPKRRLHHHKKNSYAQQQAKGNQKEQCRFLKFLEDANNKLSQNIQTLALY